MLLNKYGEKAKFDDREFSVGMRVCATEEAYVYEGLYGQIIEIRDGEDKETDNLGPDIECSFMVPLNRNRILELERRYSEACEEKRTIADIPFDLILMAPNMLRPVKNCRIYQHRNEESFAAVHLAILKDDDCEIPSSNNYRVVYDGNLGTDHTEDVFILLNLDHKPAGYAGYSLSIGDIVEFYGESESKFYMCMLQNFKEIEFDPSDARGIDHVV